MDVISYVHGLLGQASAWLLADVLTRVNLAQVPAVALTGVLAWAVARPVAGWLRGWALRPVAEGPAAWVVRHRRAIVDRLAPLLAPALWGLGLWVAMGVAQRLAWPSDVARVVANLLLAWLGIRLAAELVPSRALARAVAVVAWVLAALNIVHLLSPLAAILDSAAVQLGALRVSVLTVVRGALSLAVLLWAATFASRLFDQRVAQVPHLSLRAQVLSGKLVRIGLAALAVVVALTSVGIDLSAFALLTGALGVGVGLGLQKTISNLFSGFVLLLDRSIKPGDVIEVGGTYGWVSSLGARYVAVETRDGTEYLIPNEDIITHQVLNWSHKSERVRLKVGVRAPLEADLELVLALMKQAASRPGRILAQPAPNALILAFGESSVELQLRFWIADAHNGVQNVKSEALLEIWRLFRQHGVPMARPLRDVFVHPTSPEGRAAFDEPPTEAAFPAHGRPAIPMDGPPDRPAS